MSAPGRKQTFRQYTLGNEVKVSMEQSLLRFLTGKRFFLVLFGVFSVTFVWLELDVMFWGSEEYFGAFMSLLGLFFFPFYLWAQWAHAIYSFLDLNLHSWDWQFKLFIIIAAVPPAAIYALIFWTVTRLCSGVIGRLVVIAKKYQQKRGN